MKRFALLLVLLAVPALAQDATGGRNADQPAAPDYAYAIDLALPRGTMLEMGPDSCLRGPVRFKDKLGRTVFEMVAGDEYPVGCGRQAVSKLGK